MADPTPSPVSPTGMPFIPPALVPWITLVYSVVIVTLGVLIQQYPNVTAFSLAMALVGAFGGIFGIVSPGLRAKPQWPEPIVTEKAVEPKSDALTK